MHPEAFLPKEANKLRALSLNLNWNIHCLAQCLPSKPLCTHLQNQHLAINSYSSALHAAGAHVVCVVYMVCVVYKLWTTMDDSYMNVQYSAFKTRATQYYSNCVNTSIV